MAEVLVTGRAVAASRNGSENGRSAPAYRSSGLREVDAASDRILYYAGWADKYEQVLGNVNPVASAHFNFTVTEPMGVVGVIAPDEPSLLGFISLIAPVIVSGN